MGFPLNSLKVQLLAGEQKATEYKLDIMEPIQGHGFAGFKQITRSPSLQKWAHMAMSKSQELSDMKQRFQERIPSVQLK